MQLGCPCLHWLWVQSSSSNALPLNMVKCASLHTPIRVYMCMVHCGCASRPSRPAGAALSPENISLRVPSPAACPRHCTHQGLTLCSPSSCSAKAIYFSCCGRKGELLCARLFKPCFPCLIRQEPSGSFALPCCSLHCCWEPAAGCGSRRQPGRGHSLTTCMEGLEVNHVFGGIGKILRLVLKNVYCRT